VAVHLGGLAVNCQSCLSGTRVQCEFEIPGQETWELNGEEYQGCPFKIVTRQSADFIRAFNFYERGYLPNIGGWLEQPAKMLDAFEIIAKELKKIESEKMRKRNLFRR